MIYFYRKPEESFKMKLVCWLSHSVDSNPIRVLKKLKLPSGPLYYSKVSWLVKYNAPSLLRRCKQTILIKILMIDDFRRNLWFIFHSTTRRLVQYSVAKKNVLVCVTTICPSTNAEMSLTICKLFQNKIEKAIWI